MLNWLDSMLNWGTRQMEDYKGKRNVRFLNLVILLGAINLFIYSIKNFFTGATHVALLELAVFALLCVAFYLNRRHFRLAFYLAFFLMELFFLLLSWIILPGRQIELFFLFIAIIPHVFFHNLAGATLIFSLNVIMYFLPQWALHPYPEVHYNYGVPVSVFTVLFLVVGFFRRQVERYEAQLLERDRMKSDFFASISHELRTPLTLAQGNLAWLLRQYHEEGEETQRIRKSQHNMERLSEMVEDLLDLSRFELGRYQVSLQSQSIHRVLSRQVAAFETYAEDRQLFLEFLSKVSEEVYVALDIRQFEKILNNLLYNAFKFTPAGGKVKVRMRLDEGQVLISVIDNGPGIPPEDLPFIFDRFYQANSHSKALGTGLGLTIARELAQLHGGELSCKSVYGLGTEMQLSLPVTHDAPEENEEFAVADYVRESLSKWEAEKPEILIVEDNAEMQEYLQELLSRPFITYLCANGAEALIWLQHHRPSLIISDVMMPSVDGFQFLTEVKANPDTSTIPFILLTAKASTDDRLRGLRLGVDDYMVKPFDQEELMVKVINLLENLRNRLDWARESGEGSATVAKEATHTADEEEAMVRKLRQYVESHLENPRISVPELAAHVMMSERQFYRKVSAITGMSPAQFVTEIRLLNARKLLVSGQISRLSQLAVVVGITTPHYLARLYYKRFGKKTSDYLSEN